MIKDDSDVTWERFGKENAYYGVLDHEKYRREKLDDKAKLEFFETGYSHVNHVLEVVARHYGGKLDTEKSALDFGCGVGRLVIPLAQRFVHVTGVDVSLSMLKEARTNCVHQGIGNVTFVESDDDLSRVSGQFDFIHSYIVLQHIPVRRGEKIIDHLLERLKPGGVVVLHVPFMRKASVLRRVVNLARKYFTPLSILVNFVQGNKWNEPFMQMNSYDVNQILRSFLAHEMRDVFIELIDTGGYKQAFFFAKMPDSERSGIGNG